MAVKHKTCISANMTACILVKVTKCDENVPNHFQMGRSDNAAVMPSSLSQGIKHKQQFLTERQTPMDGAATGSSNGCAKLF